MGQKTNTFRWHAFDCPVIHYNGRVWNMMAISFAHCPFPAKGQRKPTQNSSVITSYKIILRYDVICYIQVHYLILVANFSQWPRPGHVHKYRCTTSSQLLCLVPLKRWFRPLLLFWSRRSESRKNRNWSKITVGRLPDQGTFRDLSTESSSASPLSRVGRFKAQSFI